MNRKGIKIHDSLFILLLILGLLFQYACNISNSHNSERAPVITGVRDIHPDSSAVVKIGPGETIIIEGKYLATTKHVDFSGFAATINQALYTDSTVAITLPASIPFSQIKQDSMNTIHLVTNYGETTYKFPILPPPPVITSISNEFASPGTKITIKGQYLYFLKTVTFPGGINSTDAIGSADGTELTVTVPSGATQSGAIKVTTEAGTAIAGHDILFKDNAHVFLNFDDKNAYAPWGPKPVVITSQDQFPDISMQSGNYLHWDIKDISVGTWWVQDLATPTDGANLAWPSDIPATESASNLLVKFEVNFPGKGLSSGEVRMEINNKNDYYWKPWEDAPNGTFKTNGWQTISIPLSDFSDVTTYGDVKSMSFNLYYDNGNGSSDVSWVNVGWDNFRIVLK